ncbi:MAG: 50S ribosomal protein L6 [Verrucomicrobiota bacterium]
MSRLGKKPVTIPKGVTVEPDESGVRVKGSMGELHLPLSGNLSCEIDDDQLMVKAPDESKDSKRMLGLVRSLIVNMIEGVSRGFRKELVLEGVGFRAEVQGQKLKLNAGFSSPKEYTAPEGVKIEVNNNVEITVSGTDKQKVGDVAATIRGFCPAEPYKGKGLRYKDEIIRRKVGKTVA